MYLLDASAFISPSNLWYGIDFCTAYWDWLVRTYLRGQLISTTDLRAEISKEGTEQQKALQDWCNTAGKDLFQKPTYQRAHLQRAGVWVLNQEQYLNDAIGTFIASQDVKLIAEALARRETEEAVSVVTCEVSKPDSTKCVAIPDVCKGLGIPCVTPYEMLRQEKPSFILKAG